MFCNNCGRQIEEGSKFCNACGQPVEEPTSAQVTSSPSQTPEPQPPPPQRKSSGFPRPLKWALIVEPYFVGPAGLPVKSTAEPFQLPAQLPVGHAATVKLPLPVRCGVTSGGRGTPRSWRDWIRALATARSSSSVCIGVIAPSQCSPAGQRDLSPSTASKPSLSLSVRESHM